MLQPDRVLVAGDKTACNRTHQRARASLRLLHYGFESHPTATDLAAAVAAEEVRPVEFAERPANSLAAAVPAEPKEARLSHRL